MRRSAALFGLWLAIACEEDPTGGADAGLDAAVADALPGPDLGVDAGAPLDAEASDLGAADVGAGEDGGLVVADAEVDAGRADAADDAGRSDAAADAGRVDGGRDGGRDASADGGRDAGRDAGPDDGRDAGADAAVDGGLDAGPSRDGGAPDGGAPPADAVTLTLNRVSPGGDTVSFGLPLRPGALADVGLVRVELGGTPIAAQVGETLAFHDPAGARTGVRALVVQFPASLLASDTETVVVRFDGGAGPAPGSALVPFGSDRISADSAEVARTTVRTITESGGTYRLEDGPLVERTLFVGREARVVASYPPGYLAATGILGRLASVAEVQAATDRAGLQFLSDALYDFGRSAMYDEPYLVNPDAIVDPVTNFEGWLYDRCATFLVAYAHHGDDRFLRHALRTCSYYGRHVELTGPNAGIFDGKPDPDPKYSHLRGLYAYVALTGDDVARAAGVAIAELWYTDGSFVAPYRQGHIRSAESLWTERLLGTSLEGLYYGFRLSGDVKYLTAFREVLDTAYRHITGDAAALATINPGVGPFPPQNCWIHSAEQHAEGGPDEPWCSTWMSELTIDALLAYQDQTGDARVDEVFIRLARFLRDTGSAYFRGDVLDDTFLSPSVCYDSAESDPRMLVPLYGSGIDASGVRQAFGEYSDYEHCTDATALTAAAIRALVRTGRFGAGAIGPFASEGDAFVAMHHEFAACAAYTFADYTRPRRAPSAWRSSELAAGAQDPASFIASNRIGWPVHHISPQRKLSWWFNVSMLQFGLLADAQIGLPTLAPGAVQPPGCP